METSIKQLPPKNLSTRPLLPCFHPKQNKCNDCFVGLRLTDDEEDEHIYESDIDEIKLMNRDIKEYPNETLYIKFNYCPICGNKIKV